jgi:hypothetical protein
VAVWNSRDFVTDHRPIQRFVNAYAKEGKIYYSKYIKSEIGHEVKTEG